ncbi:MAG: hypothetical protein WD227_11680 [Vicinamibacterales bacterium]
MKGRVKRHRRDGVQIDTPGAHLDPLDRAGGAWRERERVGVADRASEVLREGETPQVLVDPERDGRPAGIARDPVQGDPGPHGDSPLFSLRNLHLDVPEDAVHGDAVHGGILGCHLEAPQVARAPAIGQQQHRARRRFFREHRHRVIDHVPDGRGAVRFAVVDRQCIAQFVAQIPRPHRLPPLREAHTLTERAEPQAVVVPESGEYRQHDVARHRHDAATPSRAPARVDDDGQ